MDSLKIIVADDHPLFREGIEQTLIRIEPSFTIYSASNGNEVLDLLYSNLVDLIFIDIRMPGRDGIEITRCIRKFNTHVKIVVVSMIDDRITVQKAFKSGANGFLHKNTDKNQLLKVIESVMNDSIFLSDEILEYAHELDLSGHEFETSALNEMRLSEREIEILQLICYQFSSKEIGQKLNLSEKTIEGHRVKLMLKTRSKNLAGLIIYAVKNGYILTDYRTKE